MRCKRESPIVDFARTIRTEDPGIGARKIWLMARDVFGDQMIGRDALYALLIADTIANPRAVFHIRGRKYICEKITVTFTTEGMSQLLKGDFYPMVEDSDM